MNISAQRDIGSYLSSVNALIANTVTAGTGADGAEQNGLWNSHIGFLSGKLVIAYSATLAQAETLTIAANLQDATALAGTGAADYGDAFAAAVVATGDTGGSTENGTVELNVDLSSARGYVRAQVTPTLSAVGTDTVDLAAILVLGGAAEYPA